jgi:hypothetical protein
MCCSVRGSFLRRVSTRRCALAVGRSRIGIAIPPPFKARAPRAVVEVSTSMVALLEEEDGEALVPHSTRARAKAPHALVLDQLGKHKALPTNQGLHSVDVHTLQFPRLEMASLRASAVEIPESSCQFYGVHAAPFVSLSFASRYAAPPSSSIAALVSAGGLSSFGCNPSAHNVTPIHPAGWRAWCGWRSR